MSVRFWDPYVGDKIICVKARPPLQVGDMSNIIFISKIFNHASLENDSGSIKDVMTVNDILVHFISYNSLSEEDKFAFRIGGLDAIKEKQGE